MEIYLNYLLSAFRNFLKNKAFSILNLLGLSTGIAACLIILQYVTYEHSYDEFHENINDLYRVRYDNYRNGELEFSCAAAVPAVGPALKDNFPEVTDYTWAFPVSGIVSYENNSFRENKLQIVTPSFFKIFSWGIIVGDTASLLKEPYTAVITESTAKKYFGDDNPLGKVISWNGLYSFHITGICKDVPDNSHLRFSFVFSAETLHELSDGQSRTAWGWYDFNTYVLLKPGTELQEFQNKFNDWLAEYRKENWEKYGVRQEFILEPVEDIHLYSDLLQESEPEESGDGTAVLVLSLIALVILIIAWINYINLTTSRAMERSMEVGIRKVAGASRTQLIHQFLTESLLLNIIAAILSAVIVVSVLPYFNRLTGRSLSIGLFSQTHFWIELVVLFLIGAILSGLYPALVLSSFKPVEAIKGKFSSSGTGFLLRKILVVFQFTASVALIAGTVFIYMQLQYMRNQDLGINIEQTLVLKGPGIVVDTTFNEKFLTFKNEVTKIASIRNLSASTNVPGDEIFWASGIRRIDETEEQGRVIYIIGMDQDYVPSFDLQVIAGRNFSSEYGTEDLSVILNEGGVKLLSYTSPEAAIDEKVRFHGEERTIVGVINNYHQMSLKQIPVPLVYRYLPANRTFFSMKVNIDDLDNTIRLLRNVWEDFFSGNPFDYFFLDEFFDRQYRIEKQINIATGVFAVLAVFIAALGLFGLSSYTTLQRTKEIGIRKVMGANVNRILLLLSKEFVLLILFSIIISLYPTYFMIRKWLDNYPYKIDISWLVFLGTGLFVILFALIAVSFQTIRTAHTNPTESLRYE